MNNKTYMIYLTSTPQTFEVKSGALKVTDPCYKGSVWCTGELPKVKVGTWKAIVGYTTDWYTMRWYLREYGHATEKIDRIRDSTSQDTKDFIKESEEERDRNFLKSVKGRVAVLVIAHDSEKLPNMVDMQGLLDGEGKASKFVDSEIHVGVDSGQAGFFDLSRHAEVVDSVEKESFERFYSRIADNSLGPDGFGVATDDEGAPFGAVSLSGWGDGGYNCYIRRNQDGELVEAYILYLYNSKDKEEQENE